jgi:hypothetical protein
MKVWIKNNRIKTHCESCWQWHPECAINLLCEHISDLEQIGDELVSFIKNLYNIFINTKYIFK